MEYHDITCADVPNHDCCSGYVVGAPWTMTKPLISIQWKGIGFKLGIQQMKRQIPETFEDFGV